MMPDANETALAGALGFAENAARQRAAHYREQAAQFRSMAEVEPLPSLRRHLNRLAREYEAQAASTAALIKM